MILSLSYIVILILVFFFFFQAEDGIRDLTVTGVQTCALPICCAGARLRPAVLPGSATARGRCRCPAAAPGRARPGAPHSRSAGRSCRRRQSTGSRDRKSVV